MLKIVNGFVRIFVSTICRWKSVDASRSQVEALWPCGSMVEAIGSFQKLYQSLKARSKLLKVPSKALKTLEPT